eukprot:g4037.t1
MSSAAKRVCIAGWTTCKYFKRAANVAVAIETLYPEKIQVAIFNCKDRAAYKDWLKNEVPKKNLTGAWENHTSSPIIWFNDNEYLGGCDDFLAYVKTNLMSTSSLTANPASLIDQQRAAWKADGEQSGGKATHGYDYDLVVIGGGSGGIACADEASKHGAKVALLDYVKPSVHGTQWGLGGTCVNVGCIPKKLCHQASVLGELAADLPAFGWDTKEMSHSWSTLCTNFKNHIRSLNFKYRVSLNEAEIDYLPQLGKLVDPHSIEVSTPGNESSAKVITAARTVIAVGGRPKPLPIPGAEFAIDSDDLFQMDWSKHPKGEPGKTCIVGASYVALETALFLKGIGYDVTVLVRSILLRGFDRESAEKIGEHMKDHGVKLHIGNSPSKIEKVGDRYQVTYGSTVEEFDTVISAIGRYADTDKIGLPELGVQCDGKSQKIICNNVDQTNVKNVYAIGDCVSGMLELTPVAIMAGRKLARRLFKSNAGADFVDYWNIPTAVFTPLEYGSVGLSEEDAIDLYGEDDIEIYHSEIKPLEYELNYERQSVPNHCKAKLICLISEDEKVIGMHYLGPNAGEITQGFAVAMRKGATYEDFRNTIGIHPTCAEDLTLLKVTKRSGESADKDNC